MDDLFDYFCTDFSSTSPHTDLLRSPTSHPKITLAADSDTPYELEFEEFSEQNNNNAIDNNTNHYVAAQTPSIPPSATCSPDILYGNYQPVPILQPAPSTTLWPIDNFSIFPDNYVTSAPLTNTISAPAFLAPPNASSFDLSGFGISQTWPTNNSPFDWNTTLLATSPLPPPAVTPQRNIHLRSYSQPTLSHSAPMARQFTSASESNEASEDDKWLTVPTQSSNRVTRTGRMRIAPSRTFPLVNDRAQARRTPRARASTTSERTPRRHGRSSISSYTSVPTSPEVTRQRSSTQQGHFTCPLSPYGCESHFWSKNEWKRHVITKHLKLGYYLCELCPEDNVRAKYQNPRKDLFTQHVWRMHIQVEDQAQQGQQEQPHSHTHLHPNQESISHSNYPSPHPSPSPSVSATRSPGRRPSTSAGNNVTEAVTGRYGDIYNRGWIQERLTPTDTFCVFCHETFHGNNATELWLEHVGRQHLVATAGSTQGGRGGSAQAQPMLTQAAWMDDLTLRAWLERYGEIVWDERRGRHVLESMMAAANMDQEEWSGAPLVPAIVEEREVDAEGEVDFEFGGGLGFSSYS